MKKRILFLIGSVFLYSSKVLADAGFVNTDGPVDNTIQRAPVSGGILNTVAVVGIALAVFLVYWFVFRKKKEVKTVK